MLLLLQKYASTYIHLFPSPEPPKNILLLIRERIAKNSSVFPYEINAQVILVTTTCYIISGDECSKKRRKKRYEEIKRGKCPEHRKKRKMRGEVKMDKCPTLELGVQDTHLREKKLKYRASHSPQKVSKEQERYISPQKSKSRIRLSPLFSPLSPFIRHTCTSWFDLLTCSSGSMVWLFNKCFVSMYSLSPTYELQISKALLE